MFENFAWREDVVAITLPRDKPFNHSMPHRTRLVTRERDGYFGRGHGTGLLQFDRDLVNLAGEAVVAVGVIVGDGSFVVGADIDAFVAGVHERHRVRDAGFADGFAVDAQAAG